MSRFRYQTACPATLDGTNSVKPSIEAEKAIIKEGDPIGMHRTMAEIWIHEWGHLLNRGVDPQAVDSDGRPLFDSSGNKVIAYGWDNIVNLAKANPEVAADTPDAYALFANAMFFDNFDWSLGKAVKLS